MTDVLEGQLRVTAARPSVARSDPVASVWIRGAFAALWAAALGLASLVVVALVVWAADSRSNASAGASMRLRRPAVVARPPDPVARARRRADAASARPHPGARPAGGARDVDRGPRQSLCGSPGTSRSLSPRWPCRTPSLPPCSPPPRRRATIRPSGGAAFVCAGLVAGLFASIGAARGAGVNRAVWRRCRSSCGRRCERRAARRPWCWPARRPCSRSARWSRTSTGSTRSSAATSGAPGIFSMLLLSLLLVPNARGVRLRIPRRAGVCARRRHVGGLRWCPRGRDAGASAACSRPGRPGAAARTHRVRRRGGGGRCGRRLAGHPLVDSAICAGR